MESIAGLTVPSHIVKGICGSHVCRNDSKVVAYVKGLRPAVGADVDSETQQTITRHTCRADSVCRERTAPRRTEGITCKRDVEHIRPERNP